MKLVAGWRRILRRAWSVRVALLGTALSGLYLAWPAFQDTLPPIAFAGVAMALNLAMFILRLMRQPGGPVDADD